MSKPIYPASSWNLPPTFKQSVALTQLGVQDKDMPTTRWEARRVIYELRQRRKVSNNGKQSNVLSNDMP